MSIKNIIHWQQEYSPSDWENLLQKALSMPNYYIVGDVWIEELTSEPDFTGVTNKDR